jgi:malic enzyme
VTAGIAEAVIRQAARDGVARKIPPEPIAKAVAETMWFPEYLPYRAI